MSLVAISGNASGTGTLTIAAPNTNSNRTLTLPDGTGTFNISGVVNEVPAGTVSAPSIYPTGDTNTGIFFPAADTIAFTEGGVEAGRFDSSGNFLVNTTQTGATNTQGMFVKAGTDTYAALGHATGVGSGNGYMIFLYAGGAIGTITQNGTTGVLYNLTSDYRLKNEQQPLTGAKDFIMALKPKKWQWWDGSGEGVGFVAHEFMEVAKYSGQGEKDAVDENGKPKYQSIQPSSSEVMANMIALMQEQQALIIQLQADVAELKGTTP